MAASERTNNAGTSKGADMYSVKVTGEGWDAEKGNDGSSEDILPFQGVRSQHDIMVTTNVVVL